MKKYLIIAPPRLKEGVHLLPFIKRLHQDSPSCEIRMVAKGSVVEFFREEARIIRVYDWEEIHDNIPQQVFQLIKQLNTVSFDTIFILDNSKRAGFLGLFLSVREKVAFHTQPFSRLYDRKINFKIADKTLFHRTQRYLLLTNRETPEPESPELSFEDSTTTVPQWDEQPYFVVAPGPEKMSRHWTAVNWEALMKRLPQNCPIYIFGGLQHQKICSTLRGIHPRAQDYCGKLSLKEEMLLMKKAQRVFTNDNDQLYLASAVNAALTVCPDFPVDAAYEPLNANLKIVGLASTGKINMNEVFTAEEMLKATEPITSEKEYIVQAKKILASGEVILHQTDTIPGLAADAMNEKAVKRIKAIKERDDRKSLLLLVSDIRMLKHFVKKVPDLAFQLMDRAGRHPLTIIYPAGKNLPESVLAEDRSIGIRIPQSDFLQKFIGELKFPLVSTSANKSGAPAPQELSEVTSNIKAAVDFILPVIPDKPDFGASSTIIKIFPTDTMQVLREGNMPEMLREFISMRKKNSINN